MYALWMPYKNTWRADLDPSQKPCILHLMLRRRKPFPGGPAGVDQPGGRGLAGYKRTPGLPGSVSDAASEPLIGFEKPIMKLFLAFALVVAAAAMPTDDDMMMAKEMQDNNKIVYISNHGLP